MPGRNGKNSKSGNETIAAAITEVSERVTSLVHDEIELAKAEMTQKVTSLARGAAAVAAGAVFGIFAVIFGLATLAWGLNSLLGSIWLGFVITFVVLLALTAGAFLFAWRKLKVGAPKPQMAIDEAKKIRQTVSNSGSGSNGSSNGHGSVDIAAVPAAPAFPPAPPIPSAPPAPPAVPAAPAAQKIAPPAETPGDDDGPEASVTIDPPEDVS